MTCGVFGDRARVLAVSKVFRMFIRHSLCEIAIGYLIILER